MTSLLIIGYSNVKYQSIITPSLSVYGDLELSMGLNLININLLLHSEEYATLHYLWEPVGLCLSRAHSLLGDVIPVSRLRQWAGAASRQPVTNQAYFDLAKVVNFGSLSNSWHIQRSANDNFKGKDDDHTRLSEFVNPNPNPMSEVQYSFYYCMVNGCAAFDTPGSCGISQWHSYWFHLIGKRFMFGTNRISKLSRIVIPRKNCQNAMIGHIHA